MKTIEKANVELTVKRADGKIEKVVTDNFGEIDDRTFAKIKAANKNAGRGDVLEYRNIPAIIEWEKADLELQDYCESRKRIEEAMNY